jgi:hypothetical protein
MSQAVIRLLDVDDPRSIGRTVTAAEAQAVLDSIEGRDTPCSPTDAAEAVGRLLGLYPGREITDARTYAQGLTAMLAAYPRDFVKRVCNPVTGLPSRLKFLPTLADLREALDAERLRRDRIAASARWVLAQAARQRKEADEEAAFEANRPSAEERSRRVRELINGLRNSMHSGAA